MVEKEENNSQYIKIVFKMNIHFVSKATSTKVFVMLAKYSWLYCFG